MSTPAAESVTFKTTSAGRDSLLLSDKLTGKLTKPEGNGPFPAVVLLHSCHGIVRKFHDHWVEILESWGYVILQVDSFGPRGETNICGNFLYHTISSPKRAQDAYDAKSYLTGLPFVDRNRIAVLGWGHGGWGVLRTVSEYTMLHYRGDPFRAAVAFYPYCNVPLIHLNAPLLILIGEHDDWSPARKCSLSVPPGLKREHEIILKIYRGVSHCFDCEGMNENYLGHWLIYDPVAASDAITQVRKFLAKHLQ
jgi:dienelactone hydrolase